MKIERATTAYNHRRYGKPWIARVDFSSDLRGVFAFGTWIGSPGEDGILMVEAEVGDIIATGQKDSRNSRYSAPHYSVVTEDGSLAALKSKAEAFTVWRQKQGSK